ncbi:ADP-ribosyltransferase [Nocardia testacea]|uniref:ADP-ribosyltransferase n=1 Tax=Nocardia testacea TaxID=248551 RepID=UPI00340F5F53
MVEAAHLHPATGASQLPTDLMKYLTGQLQRTLATLTATASARLRAKGRESAAGANTLAAASERGTLGFVPATAGTPRPLIGSGRRLILPGPELTRREIIALETYTGTGSPEVNTALREGRGIDFRHDIADLRSALRKLPDYPGIVCRNIDLPEEILVEYQEGAIIKELGFMSTSTRQYALKRGNLHMAMTSFTGKSVKDYSADPGEEDVVFIDGISYQLHTRRDRIEQGRLHRYISAVQMTEGNSNITM